MGRAPCCDKANVKKGPWSPEEDAQLKEYIDKYGTGGNWIALPQKAGLKRCGKSCRLRWLNYLRPNIKHGEFSEDEDRIICSLYATIGSRWSIIAAQLPGRTDNDIKNYWNTKLKKKLMGMANYNSNKKSELSHHRMIKSTNLGYNNPISQSPLNVSPPLSSLPSYKSGSNYYNAPSSTFSFTGFDHPTLLTNSSSSTFIQNPMQSNYLVFGGAPEPSCSSSDGSYFYNGSSMEGEDQKIVFGKTQNNNTTESWIWEETAATNPEMDYGLEEIKQLISTNSTTTPINGDFNNCSSFNYFDENKTGERAMMYY